MWDALHDIAAKERISVHAIATEVALKKPPGASLTSAIRVFIMTYYRRMTVNGRYLHA